MNLDTFELAEEEFKLLFQGKADLLCQLIKQLRVTFEAYEVPKHLYNDNKFFWDSLSEVLYAASEDARLIQKEKNPDVIKKRRYSFEFDDNKTEEAKA